MERYQIKITVQVWEHLRLIRDYIARELMAPETAKRMIALLRQEISSLSQMPERFKLIDEMPWREMGFRKSRVKNYYDYFWIYEEKKEVQVIAVIYVHRNQARQLMAVDMDQE